MPHSLDDLNAAAIANEGMSPGWPCHLHRWRKGRAPQGAAASAGQLGIQSARLLRAILSKGPKLGLAKKWQKARTTSLAVIDLVKNRATPLGRGVRRGST